MTKNKDHRIFFRCKEKGNYKIKCPHEKKEKEGEAEDNTSSST